MGMRISVLVLALGAGLTLAGCNQGKGLQGPGGVGGGGGGVHRALPESNPRQYGHGGIGRPGVPTANPKTAVTSGTSPGYEFRGPTRALEPVGGGGGKPHPAMAPKGSKMGRHRAKHGR